MDTIFALATAQGKAGVAIVRVSGSLSHEVAKAICGKILPSRGMEICKLIDGDGEIIDHALVLSFTNPNSFTGENIVEFQIHGSNSVVSKLLAELGKFDNCRLAEPGEFTKRALENGKLDLSQVEGLADLIDAETEAQRRQAQVILSGGLSKLAERWRQDLIRAASLIEVTIDFADEDVPVDVSDKVLSLLSGVMKDLKKETESVKIAERIRNGFEIAIIGAPNVGKSTLLNALSGREAAITSEYAGTTRDVIEVHMDIAGLPVTLLDTAGLRETSDHVESIGIQRAKDRAEAADLRVYIGEEKSDIDIDLADTDIWLLPKADLRNSKEGAISGHTGIGIEKLVSDIADILIERTSHAGIATRERHRVSLLMAFENLSEACKVVENGSDFYDIVAEEIRSAIRALEMLVGRIDVENLLDEIFSSFCLGK